MGNKPKANTGKNKSKQRRTERRRNHSEQELNENSTKGNEKNNLMQALSVTSLSKFSGSIQTEDLRDVIDEFEGRGPLILDGYESTSSKRTSRQNSAEPSSNSDVKIDLQKSSNIGELLEHINRSKDSAKKESLFENDDTVSTDSLNFVMVQQHELKKSKSYEELLKSQQEQKSKGFLGRFLG